MATLFDNSARQASRLLKALSNEHRLLIMCRLSEGEKSVGQLEAMIGLGQSALSQHLARLRRDDLVKTRREAQTIYYSLIGDEAIQVISVLYGIYCETDEQSVDDKGGLRLAGGTAVK